jgi:uncharacterized delta-60 repeat protein
MAVPGAAVRIPRQIQPGDTAMRFIASTFIALSSVMGVAQAGVVLDSEFGGGGRTLITSTADLNAIATLPMPNGDVTVVYSVPHLAGVCDDAVCIGLTRLDSSGQAVSGGSRIKAASLFQVRAAAIDRFGRIVVIGETQSGGVRGFDYGVVRFRQDLSDDTGFGGDGGVAIDFGAGRSNNDVPLALAFDFNANIVAVGEVDRDTSGDEDIGIVRLSEFDGAVDPAFGKRFVAFDLSGPAEDGATAVIVDSNGRIVIGGQSLDVLTGELRATVTRLTAQGGFDTTFCPGSCNFNSFPAVHDGRRTYFFGSLDGHSDVVTSLAVDAAGNIVIAGSTVTGPDELRRSAIARFDADGEQTREHVDLQGDAFSVYQGVAFDGGAMRFVVSGATGFPTRVSLVQAFDAQLAFVPGYGNCGVDGSAFCFGAGSGTQIVANFGFFPALNIDVSGRPLVAATFRASGSVVGSVLAARLTNDTVLFADGFD